MKERSLVVFTLLAQLCVGAFLILGSLDLPDFSLLIRSLPWIGFLFALALLASLFHLGSRSNAYRAAANWRSSWLSREILSSLAFAGFLVVIALLSWLNLVSHPILLPVFIMASLCGLGIIYCMARVYVLRTVDAWNRWTTPVTFSSAALFLGSLAAGSAILLTGELAGVFPWLGILSLLAFGMETLVWLPVLIKPPAAPSPWSDPLQSLPHPAWRIGLAAIGLLAFYLAVFFLNGDNTTPARTVLALFGLAVVFIAEVLARTRFYQLRKAQVL